MLGLRPAPTLELRPDGVAAPEPGAPPALAPSVSPSLGASRVPPSVVQPLSPGRYKVQFTASAEFHHKLERLRALMGSRGPDGDLAAVIEQAVTEKLERLEARRFARTKAPRKGPAKTKTEETRPSPHRASFPRRRSSTRLPPRATSPRPSGVPCMSATETDAATWTSKVDGVRSATSSNSTIGTHSALAVTTAWRTSG